MNAKTASTQADQLKPGDTISVPVKRLGINGEGVGYYRKKAVFIPGAIPGEQVRARVTRAERSYVQAELQRVEKRSPDRIEPPCPVYAECGGCQLQHMAYDAQLREKTEIVREAFNRYTRVRAKELPLRPMLGMSDPWGYRNKAQLQVGQVGDRVVTGLYSENTHRLVDISGCPVHDPAVNRVIQTARDILARLKIPVYRERTRAGIVRTLVARTSPGSGDVQLTLITATKELPRAKEFVQAVRRELPEVVTVAQNVNAKKTSLIFGDETVILWGEERLPAKLGDVKFDLSPRAFFQLNTEQTIKLYDAVREAAGLTGKERVVDAYCGTGTIALWLAPDAAEVRGIEVVPEAIADAKHNAKACGFDHVRFYVGKSEQLLPAWVKEGYRPDVVAVDPPRSGCEESLLRALLHARAKRIVYVSCNPSTLAKDCKILLDGGYRLEWIQPVDMFPQTAHVECCVSLVRKN